MSTAWSCSRARLILPGGNEVACQLVLAGSGRPRNRRRPGLSAGGASGDGMEPQPDVPPRGESRVLGPRARGPSRRTSRRLSPPFTKNADGDRRSPLPGHGARRGGHWRAALGRGAAMMTRWVSSGGVAALSQSLARSHRNHRRARRAAEAPGMTVLPGKHTGPEQSWRGQASRSFQPAAGGDRPSAGQQPDSALAAASAADQYWRTDCSSRMLPAECDRHADLRDAKLTYLREATRQMAQASATWNRSDFLPNDRKGSTAIAGRAEVKYSISYIDIHPADTLFPAMVSVWAADYTDHGEADRLLAFTAEETRRPAMAQRNISYFAAIAPAAISGAGGPHWVSLGAPFAVAGDFGQAEPPVERLCAAVDRQHVENQVLACALCSWRKQSAQARTWFSTC